MTGKEYCRYIRTYSELEGLQRAHTVVYCAQTVPGGVLALEQRGGSIWMAGPARTVFEGELEERTSGG